MPCYIIGEIEITDAELMTTYLPLAQASKEKYGGRYVARGATPQVLEGAPAKRINITEFDDVEAAMRWWNSPEFSAARKIRQRASNARVMLVEGGGTGVIREI